MVGRVGGFAAPLMIELQFIDGTLLRVQVIVKSKPSLDYLVFNLLPPRWYYVTQEWLLSIKVDYLGLIIFLLQDSAGSRSPYLAF